MLNLVCPFDPDVQLASLVTSFEGVLASVSFVGSIPINRPQLPPTYKLCGGWVGFSTGLLLLFTTPSFGGWVGFPRVELT